MNKKLVVLAGNLAVGKTSLATKIGESLNWYVGYESVTDNPYLVDFYADMKIWAYHLQIYFLGHRAKQHNFAYSNNGSAILDRSIYEDAYVFAKALHHNNFITLRDYNSYLSVFELIVNELPPPDLMVYLKAPTNVILERIRRRGQEFDKNLSAEYFDKITEYYDNWIPTFKLCPVLIVNSGDLDYINNEEHFLYVKNLILTNL